MSAFRVMSRRVQSGFGLVEMMVALVLGLLVVGAAFAIFQSNQRTFSSNQGLNRIQEGARAAFEMMGNDLRAAGGSACSNVARPDVEHSNNTRETAFLSTPVSGSGSEFTVTSADDDAYPVTTATTNSVTINVAKVQEDNPSFSVADAFKAGDFMIICNASQLYVVGVQTVSGNVVSFAPATLSAPEAPSPAAPSTAPVGAPWLVRLVVSVPIPSMRFIGGLLSRQVRRQGEHFIADAESFGIGLIRALRDQHVRKFFC